MKVAKLYKENSKKVDLIDIQRLHPNLKNGS
jgi:hypothetical protein